MGRASVIVGLAFGDEGKGLVTDFLARTRGAQMVVRFGGGAQCGHNVVTPEGQHHTFAQFGSAAFVPGVRTHLSRHMLINPIFMMAEEAALQKQGVTDAFQRTTVEREALLTNPFQVAANRLREMIRGESRHGSCGMGINETVVDALAHPSEAIRVEDLDSPTRLRLKLQTSQIRKYEELVRVIDPAFVRDASPVTNTSDAMRREWEVLKDTSLAKVVADRFLQWAAKVWAVDEDFLTGALKTVDVLFEGHQGVLLDQDAGFFPHVTRSTTTFANAVDLIGKSAEIEKIGVLRAYGTRHGAGPFPTEDRNMQFRLPHEVHNKFDPWQQGFRVGHFDAVLARYAIEACGGVDQVVLTNVDRVEAAGSASVCIQYDYEGSFDPYFKGRMGRIEGIKPGPLDPKRTKALERVRPVYKDYGSDNPADTSWTRHFIESVSWDIHAPIRMFSCGPTTNDMKVPG